MKKAGKPRFSPSARLLPTSPRRRADHLHDLDGALPRASRWWRSRADSVPNGARNARAASAAARHEQDGRLPLLLQTLRPPRRSGRSKASPAPVRSPRASPPPAPTACIRMCSSAGSSISTGTLPPPGASDCTMARPRASRTRLVSSIDPGLGAHSASVSRTVRMSRIATPSSSRYCSTFCTVVTGTTRAAQILDELGRLLFDAIEQAPASPRDPAIRPRARPAPG